MRLSSATIRRTRTPIGSGTEIAGTWPRGSSATTKVQHSVCADCKVSYPPYVLDFDHLGDKRETIANLVRAAASIETLLSEIAKCELVCSNCHRIRTWTRGDRTYLEQAALE